ncbi:MAG TPA: pyridoxal phosphate-dependent aminotransferase [Synergistaceae bacterium]|nr:pyridoxal phosphate-dependent aminotransferase [Synergistaceae bacterium]
MDLSKRAQRMEPSATLAVVGKAKQLKREGKPVISFGAGEPDFNPPPAAIRYAKEAIDAGHTHYTQATGIPELKEAVTDYYKKRFNLSFSADQVIVGAGAKPLIYSALSCLVDPGDEVIVFSPAWVSYVEQIRLCGGEAAVVNTIPSGCMPDPEKVRQIVTHKTRGMLINSPNNPTGAVYDSETLQALVKIAEENDLWIIYDEIYERLVYGKATHENPLALVPDASERIILVNGVSKAYAMTGWRIGYAIAPKWLSTKIGAFQGHLTSNPCSIAQWAALGALREAENDVVKMRGVFEERRKTMIDLLEKMPHITFGKPDGAFYVFVNVEKTFGMNAEGKTVETDLDFCSALLSTEYVAAVPGTAFLAPGNIRLSYSNSLEEIQEGMKRLHHFLESLS